MISVLQAVVGAVGLYAVYVLGRFLARRRPGEYVIPIPPSALSMVTATFYPPKGWIANYHSNYLPYERIGKTVLPLIWPLTGQRYVYIGDAAALKVAFNDRHSFVKDTNDYDMITFFGKNIAGTEGDPWVRHRSITRKSFGERNNALLWTETVATLNDWFEEWDSCISRSASYSTIIDATEALRSITLLVIASAGFGIHFPREDHAKPPASHSITFRQALFNAIDSMVLKIMVPDVFYRLPIKALRQSDLAYKELRRYIQEMIDEKRDGKHVTGEDDKKEESADLFRRLVEANEDEQASGQTRLSDSELVSNIYVFFLAGHETSAHTLTFALALLAIHPDIQEKVYEESKRLWPTTSNEWNTSQQSDYNKLEYTIAVFRETLRLFPAEVRVGRWAAADAKLPCQVRNVATNSWEPSQIMVEKGSGVVMDIAAVHHNPLYWGDDAASFKPERFIDTENYQWPRDAWIPFTAGPHVCLGQQFARIESVCILARVLRKYKIRPTDEVARLSFREQWEKLTKWTVGVTCTPGKVDLVLELRADA